VKAVLPGYAVAQLVGALRHKSEGRGFDSQCSYYFIDLIIPVTLWSGLDPASKRRQYQVRHRRQYQVRRMGVKAASE
jgi:hypothetical protein